MYGELRKIDIERILTSLSSKARNGLRSRHSRGISSESGETPTTASQARREKTQTGPVPEILCGLAGNPSDPFPEVLCVLNDSESSFFLVY